MTKDDDGPFSQVEDGGHVRRGYTRETLFALCASAGLKVSRIEYISGFLSQKITGLMRIASAIHPMFAWSLIFPLRVLPPLFDPLISRVTRWPGYTITMIATKG
jgi:hypothetical protein